jgi:phosphoglycolate phosphatase-like HAD superfamily hydrolase
MHLDGMIFDLDGTLTDTFAVCFTAFRETIRAVTGCSATDDEIYAHFGPSEEGMFQRWVPDRWEECLRLYLAAYEREHRRTGRTFPGIETALGLLRERGIPLAVVTGKGPHSAAISLAQLGLVPYFDCIETGSPEGSVKPRGIQRVLAHWGVPSNRVAYLGDVPSDVEVSRAVGVLPLAAAWEKRSDADALRALKPLVVFDAVPEFIRWIETTVEPLPENAPRAGAGTPVTPHPSREGTGS